ncbi:Dip2/Utp12 family-domain-containing protein, partial [Pyronema domesticum]
SSAQTLTSSAFSPASLKLSLYASVILGLDAYRLRIHDTNTGRLRCEHVFEKGVSVNSLEWGTLPSKDKKNSKKKRKRLSNATGASEDDAKTAVVAAATSTGSVILFSPSEGAVVGILEGEHIAACKSFVFSDEEGKGWSCGVDGKLVEWDLERKLAVRNIPLPENAVQRLACISNKVLSASHTIYSIDKNDPAEPTTFTANSTLIHTLLTSNNEELFLSAADADRFINLFSLTEKKHIGALVAESDVTRVSVLQTASEDILAAVTTEGVVEVFKAPFSAVDTTGPATRKKKALTKKSDAKVRIVRPNGKDVVQLADVTVQETDLILCWVEGGVNVEFEKVKWSIDGALSLTGTVDITRTKANGLANGVIMNGVKEVGKLAVDQAHTVVVGGDDTQDIGMEDAPAPAVKEDEEEESSDSDDAASEAGDAPEEPTFSDRLKALEVSAKPTAAAVLPAKNSLTPPTANALTSVLTQALKTNDTTLLESCLHTTDSKVILNTIRKLPSPMAVTLLEKLAERLARKPGRVGSLGAWVRWTLVAHGGYLVTIPHLVRSLGGLYSTLNTRASALPRLLALQGRLDMLYAQVELRQQIKEAAVQQGGDEDSLYVLGEDPESESDYESDQEPEEVGMEGVRIEDASYIKNVKDVDSDDEEEVDGEEEEDEEGYEDSDEEEGDARAFLDMEAEESDEEDEQDDANSVDYDDVDEESEEE